MCHQNDKPHEENGNEDLEDVAATAAFVENPIFTDESSKLSHLRIKVKD